MTTSFSPLTSISKRQKLVLWICPLHLASEVSDIAMMLSPKHTHLFKVFVIKNISGLGVSYFVCQMKVNVPVFLNQSAAITLSICTNRKIGIACTLHNFQQSLW